ncbi:gag/pol protein [Cucumis melo var. makuwa]|uniref:Gag/pol protein n=1 Tax=Cucumis melo var. makuwa TaxID=1194695 RepID=A0A5D3DW11_CUCMM|nr:gag/pol protein [Cucumis melo var. makuwa]TYK27668.1 gag/pol protein [Cucumis melo var. makuwa]
MEVPEVLKLGRSLLLNTEDNSIGATNIEAYDHWVKANEKARVYILANISDVLAKKHESLAMAREIMDSLREMFVQPSWSLKHEAIKYIYTKRMKEETSVREHVLDMMMHFNIAEVNDGPIDEANQNLTMGKEKEVEENVVSTEKEFIGGSSSKTKVRTSQMKKKGKEKTPKNSKGKNVTKGKCYPSISRITIG